MRISVIHYCSDCGQEWPPEKNWDFFVKGDVGDNQVDRHKEPIDLYWEILENSRGFDACFIIHVQPDVHSFNHTHIDLLPNG